MCERRREGQIGATFAQKYSFRLPHCLLLYREKLKPPARAGGFLITAMPFGEASLLVADTRGERGLSGGESDNTHQHPDADPVQVVW